MTFSEFKKYFNEYMLPKEKFKNLNDVQIANLYLASPGIWASSLSTKEMISIRWKPYKDISFEEEIERRNMFHELYFQYKEQKLLEEAKKDFE